MSALDALFSLEGRTALVTGASRGIGQGIALALASAGCDVVCHSTSLEGTEGTAHAITEMGRRAWQLAGDLTDREAVRTLATRTQDLIGVADILVNNAGTIRRQPAVEYGEHEWDTVVRANLDAVWFLSQQLGAGMVARGSGKIINIASLLSFQGGITVPAYTATKHAVAGLTKALANEWAARGVQVNGIAPGYFRTDNTQALRENAERAPQILARIPAARWGEPEDLAGAAVFLASRASDYVNGHLLVVDGGWMAR